MSDVAADRAPSIRDVWGVVTTDAPGRVAMRAGPLAGLVVVGTRVTATTATTVTTGSTLVVRAPPHATDGRCLAAALRRVPSEAHLVAWFGATLEPDRVARLRSVLGTRDAAVVAMPVTDAVKQVERGRIVRGVDREHLRVLQLPLLVRTAAARARLLDALDHGRSVFGALATAGLTVGLLEVPAGELG